MNSLALVLLLVDAATLIFVSRRWAPLPLLVGVCYFPTYLNIELGPLHFTAIRVLIALGIVRMMIKQEWPPNGINGIDCTMMTWVIWLLASGFFHKDPGATLIFRLGLAFDACGIYVLFRSFCRSLEDISGVYQLTALLLVPLAMEMFIEKLTVHNLFSILGGQESVMIRLGKVRANGPFAHPILAGTAGAINLPMMIALWRPHRRLAVIGIIACFIIIYSSASSGPILSAVAGIFALFMWRYRQFIPLLQRWAIPGYIALDLYMKDPAYFIIARIDLMGGSTSWYRARLLQAALEHLDEWWLIGTDYTRHWMQQFVPWSPDHTDITSQYVQMGVFGGLLLLALFVVVLVKGFSGVTQALKQTADCSPDLRFMVWALGSSLFANVVTFFSVSYFDQTAVFVYFTLANIGSAATLAIKGQNTQWTRLQFSAATPTVSTSNKIGKQLLMDSGSSRIQNNLFSRPKMR